MLLYFLNVVVCAVIVVYYFAKSLRKSFSKELHYVFSILHDSNLPPGPWGLPILGYIPFMIGKNPYTAFSKLADKYGGMAFVKLGQKNVLILRDPDMIRETYRLTAFSDRPNTKLKDDKLIGNKGIIQSVGEVWSEHRRIILSAFRTIGLKTASSVTPQASHIAEIIQRDVEEYLRFINQMVVGRPDGHIMLERLTGRLAGSTISSCVFGLQKSFSDPDFSRNVEIIEEGFKVGESVATFEFLPILRKVPGWWKKVEQKMKKNHCFTCKYFSGLIAEKSKTHSESCAHPDSLITLYQQELDKRAGWTTPHVLSEAQLMQTMTDLFCAGTETMKYSLLWAMLYMAKYPEIQQTAQKEIDAVYPNENQLPNYDDVGKMPFTEATIMEALRLRPVLPMGHARATHDFVTEHRGYEIPRQTVVLSLIWDIHQDPKYFDDPLQFRPSRFITSEGKTFRPENFMPFGTGRRLCLGDQMAMMQLFTAFASLLKRYTIKSTTGQDVDMDWKILLSLLIPKTFEIGLVPRNLQEAV